MPFNTMTYKGKTIALPPSSKGKRVVAKKRKITVPFNTKKYDRILKGLQKRIGKRSPLSRYLPAKP